MVFSVRSSDHCCLLLVNLLSVDKSVVSESTVIIYRLFCLCDWMIDWLIFLSTHNRRLCTYGDCHAFSTVLDDCPQAFTELHHPGHWMITVAEKAEIPAAVMPWSPAVGLLAVLGIHWLTGPSLDALRLPVESIIIICSYFHCCGLVVAH